MNFVIIQSIKLFYKNLDIWILLLLPMVAVKTIPLPGFLSILVMSVVSMLIAIYTYMYIFDLRKLFFSRCVSLLIKFILANSILVFVLICFSLVLVKLFSGAYQFLQYIVFYFAGLYFSARYNIIFPLLTVNEDISLKQLVRFTKGSYIQWLWAATILYVPLLIVATILKDGMCLTVLAGLQLIFSCCFNSCYYLWKKESC